MGRGQTGNRHSGTGARNVVQTYVVTQTDRARMSTMFTADPYLEAGPSPATRFHGHLYKGPQAFDLSGFEGIRVEYDASLIEWEELVFRIFAAERERGLCQVVRPE